ncbi:MAG: glycosyltransferase family 1 protein [Chitinophagaceae bacterium]|nr:MAG: glycosyltransferase family 1 protein [Chitinophagaceae bacterium]
MDIVKCYGIDPGLIDNVSCGIKEKFSPLGEEEKTSVKQRYSVNEDYFFFIGSMHPRKNIVRLIEGFELFKKNTGSKMKLILGGHILWDDDSIKTTMDRIASKDDVVFTGRLSDDELKNVLGAALALSFVPTFEGFGLPIVEAFQADVPVICSNTTSMPEVAGDAAILVDPFSVKEISEAMKKMAANEVLRNELIERGKSQKEKFTWQKTAAMLHRCITDAVRK